MSASSSPLQPTAYDVPSPPLVGQVFTDSQGAFWKVKRLTRAQHPAGFYLVHMACGTTLDDLQDSMVLGPREFAALMRDRALTPHLHSV